MAVNLDTLSISLNSFDAASDGEFNIGHIKLNEDGTGVCRTNRHKTFEFLNRDTIPPEETLAIKNAFYDALSRERLSSESMDDIRTRLGLRKGTLEALSPRDMRPLTAAQVRAIIGGAEFIGTDASGKRMLNTPQNRKQILDEITKLISQDRVEPSELAVQDLKLEGIDDDEIEGNLNIDEIEGNV